MKSRREMQRALAIALLVSGVGGAAACRQDMHNGPRFKALQKSDFYDDQRSARPLIEDTVPRGWLMADDAFATGKVNGQFVAQLPVPLNLQLLQRGEARFNIYCAPCHARTGNGDGIVVRRGYKQPPSYQDPRLRAQPVGYFYDVISHGFGQMPDYAAQIQPKDRWAIAAYVRALQVSQHATVADVPEGDRPKLDAPQQEGAGHEGAAAPAAEGHKEGSAAHE
jgi:mono/diheme cytochrome c family protein